ncbi:6815_t:CDS:2, partial [Scutellospora calospora]
SIICEVVPSIHGKDKLVVDGHLMVNDKTHNDTYYWYCKKHNTLYCSMHAITKLTGDQHKLKNVSTHNHAAEAAQADIVKAISNIKEQAHQTYNKLSQIIQATTSQISQEVHSCLLTREVLQQVIQRIHRSDLLKEPESLDDLVIPDDMLRTLDRRLSHIPTLAFLLPREIPGAFDKLKVMMPTEANELI